MIEGRGGEESSDVIEGKEGRCGDDREGKEGRGGEE